MSAAQRMLDQMRESPARWHELSYEPDGGAGNDRNALSRAKVLWALQYDHRPDDLPLVRWLAEQEARYRTALGGGLGEEAELAGFLLAGYRQVEDVWRHWAIKQANFDAGCMYDSEYLSAAGALATFDYVRGSRHAERHAVMGWLDGGGNRPGLSEEDVAEWWRDKQSLFPSDPAAEDPLTWHGRAVLVGDRDLARAALHRWAAGRQRDADTLLTLRHGLVELGAFGEAAAAQREYLAFVDGPRDVASAWLDLAELERKAGDHHAAWEALREHRRVREPVASDGTEPEYAAELFRLAGGAEAELAAVAFAEAEREVANVTDPPLEVLRAAADAARHVGDQARADQYRRLADAEEEEEEVEAYFRRDNDGVG